jgi:ABC-type phosphate/phosphonate transport system substrate-binding protein
VIASLIMYDRPETAGAYDRLWMLIRDSLGAGPKFLTRDGDVWDHWRSPELLLSQTCGYPYRAKLADQVSLIGTPIYDIDCQAGYYFSPMVVRRDDPREILEEFSTSRFAYNEALSQSGWAAPQNHAQRLGFRFENPIQSHAHVASALMVAEGHADIASLDAVSWKMMQRWDNWAAELRVIATTPPTPGLPLITAKTGDPQAMFKAVTEAIAALSSQDRDTLCLKGVIQIDKDAYLSVPNPASP